LVDKLNASCQSKCHVLLFNRCESIDSYGVFDTSKDRRSKLENHARTLPYSSSGGSLVRMVVTVFHLLLACTKCVAPNVDISGGSIIN